MLLLMLIGVIPVASARATGLLPLARGQLAVLLGQSGEWQPEAGVPETVTVIGGAPTATHAGSLTGYVALQASEHDCAASPAADHAALLSIPRFYSPADLVTAGSPLAPGGGAHGVYAAAIDAGVLGEHGSVRACVWLARSADERTSHLSETMPLLNGLVAAAVFPNSVPADGYSLDAGAVGTSFGYQIESSVCGRLSTKPRVRVAADEEASDSVSVGSLNCPTDGSRFTFFDAAGSAVGVIGYTDAEALAAAPPIEHFGGCELDGLTGLSVAAARRFVTAVGCHAGRVLTAPFDGAVSRGHVTEAQVDGGVAPLAPPGTTVDLVTDG